MALLAFTVAAFGLPASAQTDGTARLLALQSLDRRVTEVMYRLSVANVDLCPMSRNLAGWALHALDQYSGTLKPDAESTFGLQPGLPGVLVLVPGGPAANAGFLESDVIEAINGRSLVLVGEPDDRSERRLPSYERLGRQVEWINEAFAKGSAGVTFLRDDKTATVVVDPVLGCGYEAQVRPSPDLNGGADGARISITSGLVAYADSDDDLAFLLAHELAHNLLRHAERPRARGLLNGLLGHNGRSPAAVREAETAADRVGMFLAARAGYDASGAAGFRRRFGRDHAAARYGFWGYPSAEERARAHEATWLEIEALRARGMPLQP